MLLLAKETELAEAQQQLRDVQQVSCMHNITHAQYTLWRNSLICTCTLALQTILVYVVETLVR